jgi:hypothetical protein
VRITTLTRHAPQLVDAALLSGVPVVQREDRHRGVDAVVAQRQVIRRCANRRRPVGRPLRRHHVARLDRYHVPVRGLIGAGARADVRDAARVAERRVNPPGDPRVLATGPGIAPADGLVAIAHRPGPVSRLTPSGVIT